MSLRGTVLIALALIMVSMGCIMQEDFSVSEILLLSKFYDPGNYTVIEDDVLGDQQSVMFYLETWGFKTKRVGKDHEFWIAVDIIIGSENITYVEKINEKEIHVTNATEERRVWYTYAWYTGNLVRSGTYWVNIIVKDKLSKRSLEQRKEFYIDLSRKFE